MDQNKDNSEPLEDQCDKQDSQPPSRPDPKKICTEAEVAGRSISANQDVPSSSRSSGCAVQPSPPQMISLAEVTRAAEGLQNMVLAHEIAVNPEFSIPAEASGPLKDDSFAARVHEMMHKAFWDLLTSELAQDPPCYDQAMALLREVKEMLLDLVPPKATSLRTNIEERLDVELIQQQVEAGTLNFSEYAKYVINMMAKMCCPARDEDVQDLTTVTEIVPCFKGILDVLKKMKVDYANFAIREARPLIIANRITYEKKKFAEFLAAQPKGVDGLSATRTWLLRHKEAILAVAGEDSTNCNQLRMKILSEAFVESLAWPSEEVFPETLSLDRDRLQKLGAKMEIMVVLSSVVLVTLAVVGPNLRDQAAFKQTLKEHTSILLQDCNEGSLKQTLVAVAAQVLKDAAAVIKQVGLAPMTETTCRQLSGQIEAIAELNNPVRQLAGNRLKTFLKEVASSYQERQVLLPSGYSVLVKEVHEFASQFGELVWFNMVVFGEYYCDILGIAPPIVRPPQADK